jgi:hypothetical protein
VTVSVGRLRLRLPAVYAARADAIARGFAAGLGQIHPSTARTLKSLTVGPIRLDAAASDAEVVAAAIQHVSRQIKESR